MYNIIYYGCKNSAKYPPSKRTGKVPCGVCLAPVVDGKDEALLCEGECGLWLHRGCASIPPSRYESLSASDEPFVCLCCSNSQLRKELTQQGKELQSLKATVLQLSQEVSQLRALTQNPTPTTPATPAPNLSYSNIIKQAPNPSAETPAKKVPSTTAPGKKFDRKFNIVIYGIKENPEHTNRHARLAKDLESVITITNSLVPGVAKGSVRDCTRLGRYNSSRDRPLLVKFNCAHEASSILANRSKLKTLPGSYLH